MSNRKNELIINGKRYDALTGKLLDNPVAPAPNHTKQPGAIMDGVVKPKTSSRDSAASSQTAKQVHSRQERSKTLMRTAVKNPAPAHKIHSKVATHATGGKADLRAPAKTLAPATAQRHARAANIPKSSLVSRFGNNQSAADKPITLKTGILNVKEPPEETALKLAAPAHAQPSSPFDSALKHANSHHQKPPKKAKPHHKIAHRLQVSSRAVSVSAFVMASVLIGGFVAYQNVPYVAMRVAAARSGVSAGLPGYKPAGFKLSGPIRYSSGEIIVNYKSRTDDRAFLFKQSKSAWNSESLHENFIATNQLKHQIFQDKGKTVYIYNGSNATWVNGGIWYQVEGDSSLSSEQLLRIANSL